jgi:hypothetical protein
MLFEAPKPERSAVSSVSQRALDQRHLAAKKRVGRDGIDRRMRALAPD